VGNIIGQLNQAAGAGYNAALALIYAAVMIWKNR
jgi:hypothetical protein